MFLRCLARLVILYFIRRLLLLRHIWYCRGLVRVLSPHVLKFSIVQKCLLVMSLGSMREESEVESVAGKWFGFDLEWFIKVIIFGFHNHGGAEPA